MQRIIRRRALQLHQSEEHPIYVFALRPAEVMQIGAISRITRHAEDDLIGYQRAEVRNHVKDILEYLDSGQVLFPNPVILAFSDEVRFRGSRGPSADDGLVKAGLLELPISDDDSSKAAWIVDGQQRALALSRTSNESLAVPVVGFFGASVALQREQFLRVNNTKPLPRSLVTELLPVVDTHISRKLSARKLPSAICDTLNLDPRSPFHELVKRPSIGGEVAKKAVVSDTAVIEMIRQRIASAGGCLFPYRNIVTGETDTDTIIELLIAYWTGVRATFPNAWGLPPVQSRLMHGAGIKSMGNLMDAIMPRIRLNGSDQVATVQVELERIAPVCHWTSGRWEELGGLSWKDVENTSRSVKLLSNLLLREYTRSVHQQ